MEDADLYHRLLAQQLKRPAVVITQSEPSSLEHRVSLVDERLFALAFGKYSKKINTSGVRQILGELGNYRYLEHYPKEEDGTVLDEFRFDPEDKRLIAVHRHYLDKNNQKRLDRIIYRRRGDFTLVILYKRDVSGLEWDNSRNISKIYLDIKGTDAQLLDELYEYYKKLERFRKEQETLKEELKKQRKEEEGVIEFS